MGTNVLWSYMDAYLSNDNTCQDLNLLENILNLQNQMRINKTLKLNINLEYRYYTFSPLWL